MFLCSIEEVREFVKCFHYTMCKGVKVISKSMVVSLQTRDSYRRVEGRDGTLVPRVVGRVNVEGGISHTRWPSRHGLLNQPSWTSPTLRRHGCASRLCQKSQGVDRVPGDLRCLCSPQSRPPSIAKAVVKATLRCRIKGQCCVMNLRL